MANPFQSIDPLAKLKKKKKDIVETPANANIIPNKTDKLNPNIPFNPEISTKETKITEPPGRTVRGVEGGVEYTTGGKTYRLTNEEYRELVNTQMNRPSGDTEFNKNLSEIYKAELPKKPEFPELVSPEALEPDIIPSTPDILDLTETVGAAIGGGTAGFAAGTALAPFTAGLSIPILTAGGAIVGGATAFYYSVGGERKQQVKTSRAKFTAASGEMTKIMNSVNAGKMSPQQARLYWDNEYQRVLQTERELKSQTKNSYGEKLAKGLDDLAMVQAFLRRYPQFEAEFEYSISNPNPNILYTDIPQVEEE